MEPELKNYSYSDTLMMLNSWYDHNTKMSIMQMCCEVGLTNQTRIIHKPKAAIVADKMAFER